MKVVLTAQEHSDRGAILKGLLGYNESKVGPSRRKALTLVIRDSKRRVMAGLKGHTHFEWLFIAILWVDDRYRGRGIGTRLVRRAEREAIRRGCRHAWLDTFDFQAPHFYKKLGYQRFGTLHSYPAPGHRRYFLTKDLRR